MFLLLSVITLPIAASLGDTDSVGGLKLLKFADDTDSFIRFHPDLTPFVNAISVCGWLKDLGIAEYRAVFHMNQPWDELTMTADGKYIGIFRSHQHLQSKFTVPKGTWYHACITWSASSRSHRYYVNGQLLGSQQTASGRLLTTGGALTLGNWNGGSSWRFGGEMAYLNVYAKELSASEIVRMVNVGMCSNIAAVDENESYRVIKWEEIVQLERSGTVTELYIEECLNTYMVECERMRKATAEELKVTQRGLEETRAERDEMEQKLDEVSTKLNTTLAELEETGAKLEESERRWNETAEELKETQKELEETEAAKDKMEEDLSTKLNSTLAELEEILSYQNRTWDWDIFLSEEFLNKTFTTEHSELLHSSWDDITDRLVGIHITEEVLKLLEHVDPIEYRPWSMLYSESYFNEVFTREMAERLTSMWDGISDQLVGVTMTKEVINLLNHVTDKAISNCGN